MFEPLSIPVALPFRKYSCNTCIELMIQLLFAMLLEKSNSTLPWFFCNYISWPPLFTCLVFCRSMLSCRTNVYTLEFIPISYNFCHDVFSWCMSRLILALCHLRLSSVWPGGCCRSLLQRFWAPTVASCEVWSLGLVSHGLVCVGLLSCNISGVLYVLGYNNPLW